MSVTKLPTEIDPRIGTGDWAAFKDYPVEHVFEVASRWKAAVNGEPKLWLCWNVSPRWSVVQQRLAKSAGWTPLLGFDPRVGPPPVEPVSILIDFNDGSGFPVVWPHFPLEFAFLFIEQKLAFAMRNLSSELDANYSVEQVSNELGIDRLLPPLVQ